MFPADPLTQILPPPQACRLADSDDTTNRWRQLGRFLKDADRHRLRIGDDGRMSGMTERDEASRRVKLTYDDFVHFPDDGRRHELIDGEHYVTPSPNTRHQRIVRRLTGALLAHLERHSTGELFFAPYDVVFTPYDVVEPDLLYVSNERASHFITEKHALGADLVVEIGSAGTRRRDQTVKLQLYERAGVLEYWFIDPDEDIIRVYRRSGERFGAPRQVIEGESQTLTTPLLPGFELPLAALFQR